MNERYLRGPVADVVVPFAVPADLLLL